MTLQENKTLGKQSIQADQYQFPYHYIPPISQSIYLSRHWRFASSYMAALSIVADQLRPVAEAEGDEYRHIDIGCGDGALGYYLARLPQFQRARFAGVDIDERAIKWARMFNPNIEFHSCDMSEINGGYATATLVEVLEHIPPELLPNFIENTSQLLRPGGLMVITVPSVEKPVAEKHFQHFSFETIRAAVEPTFDQIQVKGFERGGVFTRMIDRVRINPLCRMDSPMLNRFVINRLSRLYNQQLGCGRLFVTCRRRLDI